MLKSITKLFIGSDEKVIKKLQPIADEINDLEPEFESFNDGELYAVTSGLRQRLSEGENLDDLLPEGFAVVREAAKRALGQRHYDVQLMGGIVLHQGKIAEMKTGEGKTLVSTLPAYLNSLNGKGVHMVTVNDYLARRDAHWMGAVFERLGVSVAALQHDSAVIYDTSQTSGERGFEYLRPCSRSDAYNADITYGTNDGFGFDYLRDNMAASIEERVQRSLEYAIVDEVDNILIDEARTPLIISGPADMSAREYQRYARVVPKLISHEDFVLDEKHKTVALTNDGITKLESLLNIENLYDPENFGVVHQVENAVKAQVIFQRDKEYVVQDGRVVIVDEFTGRMMSGRRFSDGLHQAIEAKEAVRIQPESITYANITLQNYFRLYSKLSGMTGTAATEAEEFFKIYKLEVVVVPTNRSMVREDQPDLVYRDQKAKYKAVVDDIVDYHHRGQPVLVGTTDIDLSEMLSGLLQRKGIPHEVLNAKQHDREAIIVAQAGKIGAVTVATNMAGRGTDIVLGGNPDLFDVTHDQWQKYHDQVVANGGLHIIGTERHEARRIDNQLRGRSGRQGDPGSTQFFVALDDELMRRFGGDRIRAVMDWAGMDEDATIENKMISKSIENAQVKVEGHHFDMRKHLVEYDDVVNTHRDVIYVERNKILEGRDLRANIEEMVNSELTAIAEEYLFDRRPDNWDVDSFVKDITMVLPPPSDLTNWDQLELLGIDGIINRLEEHARFYYDEMERQISSETMREAERWLMLRSLDANWVQHLTSMENLRQGIGLHAFGQRDPLVMYKKEGHEQFQALHAKIAHDIVYTLFNAHITVTPNGMRNKKSASLIKGRQTVPQKQTVMSKVSGKRTEQAVSTSQKVGRNQPCPCGSMKKFKRCHGA